MANEESASTVSTISAALELAMLSPKLGHITRLEQPKNHGRRFKCRVEAKHFAGNLGFGRVIQG